MKRQRPKRNPGFLPPTQLPRDLQPHQLRHGPHAGDVRAAGDGVRALRRREGQGAARRRGADSLQGWMNEQLDGFVDISAQLKWEREC